MSGEHTFVAADGTTHCRCGLPQVEALARASAGAGLDVELLRQATDNVREMDPLDYLDEGDETDAIATEYARLRAVLAEGSETP